MLYRRFSTTTRALQAVKRVRSAPTLRRRLSGGVSVTTMRDESKAIEEVAKTTGKAIDASRELGGFLSKYVGGSLEHAMGIVEDKLKYLRWERQIRLTERANTLLAERGLAQPSRKVPLQVAIPLIQAASLEEDDWLQDQWAALLVNAADAASHVEVRRAFISILEDLTPLDALLLKKIYSLTGFLTWKQIYGQHICLTTSPNKSLIRKTCVRPVMWKFLWAILRDWGLLLPPWHGAVLPSLVVCIEPYSGESFWGLLGMDTVTLNPLF